MTRSNHSKTLPIVAAAISRFIEGGFGSAAAGNVSAVMSGLPGVMVAAFIRLPGPLRHIAQRLEPASPFSGWVRTACPLRGDKGKDNPRSIRAAAPPRHALEDPEPREDRAPPA